MADIDRRIGELMVRLRLSRPAATRQAMAEAPTPPPAPTTPGRKSDVKLVA